MNGNININININVDPRFTEAICTLAAAFGYPADTIASSMKQTAKVYKEQAAEMKAGTEQAMSAMSPKKFAEKIKQAEKVWEPADIQKVALKAMEAVGKEKVLSILRGFKTEDGKQVTRISQLQESDWNEAGNKFEELTK